MKFTPTTTTQNILSTPGEYAVLESISENFCRYSFIYTVNPFLCAQNNAFLVRIIITTKPFVENKTTVFNNTNAAFDSNIKKDLKPEEAINNLLTRTSQIKDLIKSSKFENEIFRINSDITKKLSTDLAPLLNNKDLIGNSELSLKKDRTFATVDKQELLKKNKEPISYTALSEPLFTTLNSENKRKSETAELGQKLLFQNNIDPSSLVGKQSNILSPPLNYGGYTPNDKLSDELEIDDKDKIAFINALLEVEQPSETNVVTVPVTIERTKTINCIETITFDIDSIGASSFYLTFELVNSQGITLERLVRNVEHNRFISTMGIPIRSPEIYAMAIGVGVNKIKIKQKDQVALGVLLYRKQYNTDSFIYDGAYSLVSKIPLSFNEEITVEDRISNINPVIYRAIPYGRNDVLAGTYGSSVARYKTTVQNTKRDFSNTKKFFTFLATNTNEGINLNAINIPKDVFAVWFYRIDHKKTDKIKELVKKPVYVGKEKNTSATLLDNDIKKDRIYDYFVEFEYSNGTKKQGSSFITIQHKKPTSGLVSTEIKNAEVIKSNITPDGYDIKFDIISSFLEKDDNLLQKALENAGALSYFQGSIDRDKLRLVVAYKIYRINEITGEVEDLGITTESSFLDSRFSSVKGAKPLREGNEYRYRIITYFRTPDTVLKNTTTEVLKRRVLNSQGFFEEQLDYSFEPYKWKHPITLNEGIIVSPESLKRNYANTDFTFGEVGATATIKLSISDANTFISQVKATRFNQRAIRVEWKVVGKATKIDHFIICYEQDGYRNIVGKCHNITNSNTFIFIDYLDNSEKGALTYIVIPIYYDYSKGKEEKADIVVV